MMKAQQEAGSAPRITPKMVDWILYNMPALRDQIEALEPRSSTSVVVLSKQNTWDPVSGVEKVAIKRAAASAVLDAVRRLKPCTPSNGKFTGCGTGHE